MDDKKRIIIHVGFPKCGSSTLQAVFAQCAEINYWGKRQGHNFVSAELQEFTRIVAPMSDVRLVGASKFRRHFANLIANSTSNTIVISDEVLSSVGMAPRQHSNSLPQIIENFNQVLPHKIEVLIVIREQRSFLKSYYRQYVRGGAPDSYEEFIEHILYNRYRYILPSLNYSNLLQAIRPLVSKLHVAVFEKLFTDVAYRDALCNDIGIPEASALIANTHLLPARSDDEVFADLTKRFPSVWSTLDPWYRRGLFPTIFQARFLSTPYGNSVKGFVERKTKKYSNENAERHRLHAIEKQQNLFEITPLLQAKLEKTIRTANTNLQNIDRDIDWPALGYLL